MAHMRILGHERQVGYLNRVLKRGRLAHAYLFYGPDHLGKLTIAKALAKTLRCEAALASSSADLAKEDKNQKGRKSLDSACGACAECRMIDADLHPQVIVLDPAHTLTSDKDTRKDIPIGDIRELKRRFSLAPESDRWRVAIINAADAMSDEAADALLKLLEEPGSRTLLIVISSAQDLLSATVRSRAHAIRFAKVAEEKIALFLEGEPCGKEMAREIADRAFGCPGLAIRMARDAQYRDREKKFVRRFAAALAGGIPQMFAMSKDAAGDEGLRQKTADEILRVLYRRLRDAAEKGGAARAAQKMRAAGRIAELLAATNINPRLALDMMFLEISDG